MHLGFPVFLLYSEHSVSLHVKLSGKPPSAQRPDLVLVTGQPGSLGSTPGSDWLRLGKPAPMGSLPMGVARGLQC